MPTVSTLATSLNAQINERTSDCALLELGADDSPTGDNQVFQYYPESFTDSKPVNYQTKEIFGGSLPLYQFSAGGERTIAFSVVFTCDVDLLGAGSPTDIYQRLKASGQERRNVDIRAAFMWLRGYMLPRYEDATVENQLGASSGGTQLTFAPNKALLSMPGTGIGMYGGDSGVAGADSIRCHMSQCDMTVDALFPSGLPRAATVQLSFVQEAQTGGAIVFPSRTSNYDKIRKGVTGTLGYNFPPKGVSLTSLIRGVSSRLG